METVYLTALIRAPIPPWDLSLREERLGTNMPNTRRMVLPINETWKGYWSNGTLPKTWYPLHSSIKKVTGVTSVSYSLGPLLTRQRKLWTALTERGW